MPDPDPGTVIPARRGGNTDPEGTVFEGTVFEGTVFEGTVFEAADPWGEPAAPPPPPPKGRVRTVEKFKGPRLKSRTGPWRRIRSAFGLLVITLILGAALGAVLSAIVWGISVGIHHASGS